MRSLEGYRHVTMSRHEARKHLKLCSMIARIQVNAGRHVHLENPWGAESWLQPELHDLLRVTLPAKIDQCQFGLKHPTTDNPMQKRTCTCVQTTSQAMQRLLDHRLCDQTHQHSQIAGTCKIKGVTVSVSKFASMYPRTLARAIVKGIQGTHGPPAAFAVCHVDDLIGETGPPQKRAKIGPSSDPADHHLEINDERWNGVFKDLQSTLPKSGITTWFQGSHSMVARIQELLPTEKIAAIKVGKGLERYIVGDHAWLENYGPASFAIYHICFFNRKMTGIKKLAQYHNFASCSHWKSLPENNYCTFS